MGDDIRNDRNARGSAPAGQMVSLKDALGMAVRLHQEGRLAEAEQIYQKILRVEADQVEALHFLGLLRHQMEQHEEAIRLMSQAISLDPEYADAINNLGNVFKVLERFDEAGQAFRKVIDLRPDQSGVYSNLGAVLKAQGNLPEAVAAYQKAIALNPSDARAYFNLGNALVDLKKPEKALAAFETSVALDPDQANALFELGTVCRELGETELALNAFDRAAKLDAKDAKIQLARAKLFLEQGALEFAIQAFRRVIALDPESDTARHYLAVLLETTGHKDSALEIWRDWLKRDPHHPVPNHMLAALTGENVPDRARDAYVSQVFDGFAATFNARLQSLKYRAPEFMHQALMDQLGAPAGNLQILDAGCGTGLCGEFLRPYASQLVGVDLSSKMLDQSWKVRAYDELTQAELTSYLESRTGLFDVIVSADTLVYFGALESVLRGASGALKAKGLFAFTLERMLEPQSCDHGFRLHSRGRYSHNETYVKECVDRTGLVMASLTRADLREEANQPVAGLVVVTRKR